MNEPHPLLEAPLRRLRRWVAAVLALLVPMTALGVGSAAASSTARGGELLTARSTSHAVQPETSEPHPDLWESLRILTRAAARRLEHDAAKRDARATAKATRHGGAVGRVTTDGTRLRVRFAPRVGSSVLDTLPDGAQVTIVCQTRGGEVTGTYGTSSLWDKLSNGGYVADAYVYTGSDSPVASRCTSRPDDYVRDAKRALAPKVSGAARVADFGSDNERCRQRPQDCIEIVVIDDTGVSRFLRAGATAMKNAAKELSGYNDLRACLNESPSGCAWLAGTTFLPIAKLGKLGKLLRRGAPGTASRLVPGGGLAAHEAAGGHVLAKHVGKSDADLLARIAREPKISGDSTFATREIAEAAIADVISANSSLIRAWLSGTGRKLPISGRSMSGPVGRHVAQGSTTITDVAGIRAVLVRDPNMPTGYRIQTAFPEP